MFFALAWKEAILKKKSIIIKYAHTRQTVSQKHQDLKSSLTWITSSSEKGYMEKNSSRSIVCLLSGTRENLCPSTPASTSPITEENKQLLPGYVLIHSKERDLPLCKKYLTNNLTAQLHTA